MTRAGTLGALIVSSLLAVVRSDREVVEPRLVAHLDELTLEQQARL